MRLFQNSSINNGRYLKAARHGAAAINTKDTFLQPFAAIERSPEKKEGGRKS
jgi:hypothetical protein